MKNGRLHKMPFSFLYSVYGDFDIKNTFTAIFINVAMRPDMSITECGTKRKVHIRNFI